MIITLLVKYSHSNYETAAVWNERRTQFLCTQLKWRMETNRKTPGGHFNVTKIALSLRTNTKFDWELRAKYVPVVNATLIGCKWAVRTFRSEYLGERETYVYVYGNKGREKRHTHTICTYTYTHKCLVCVFESDTNSSFFYLSFFLSFFHSFSRIALHFTRITSRWMNIWRSGSELEEQPTVN